MPNDTDGKEKSNAFDRLKGRALAGSIVVISLLIVIVLVEIPSIVAIPLGWIVGDATVVLGPATYTIACPEANGGDPLRGAINFKTKREDFVRFLLEGRCPTDAPFGGGIEKEADPSGSGVYDGINKYYGDDLIGHFFQEFGELVGRGYEDGVRDFGPQFIFYIAQFGILRFLYWSFLYCLAVIITAFFANIGTTVSKAFLGSGS